MHMMQPIDEHSEFDIDLQKKPYVRINFNKQGLTSQRNNIASTTIDMPSVENLCPKINVEIHIGYSVQSILRKFKVYAQQFKYIVTDAFDNELILVEDSNTSRIKNYLRCLFPNFKNDVIRFYVYTDEYRSLRMVCIENLNKNYEDSPALRQFLVNFCVQLPTPQLKQELEEQPDIYSLEATSHYMFNKMLLEDNYSMGKKVSGFIKKFKISQNDTLNRQDIQWIQSVKDQIVGDMLKGFNCSRKELTEILAFCRTIIEAFLYQRIVPVSDRTAQKLKILTGYQNTQTQITKLNNLIIPDEIVKQIFWVMCVFDIEYGQHDYSKDKQIVLVEVLQSIRMVTLHEKLRLLHYYSEINGENDQLILFERAYELSRKQ